MHAMFSKISFTNCFGIVVSVDVYIFADEIYPVVAMASALTTAFDKSPSKNYSVRPTARAVLNRTHNLPSIPFGCSSVICVLLFIYLFFIYVQCDTILAIDLGYSFIKSIFAHILMLRADHNTNSINYKLR